MKVAQSIRLAVAQVEQLRAESAHLPGLAQGVSAVKLLQSRRFAGTYSDLLATPPHDAAARFFLEELYGDRNFAERDAQFARIAGAVERLFPRDVAETAAGLASLHALTESLDHGIAATATLHDSLDVTGYVRGWKALGRRDDRQRQLEMVVGLGSELARLTRTHGLRLMLKLMRAPATAAGMGSLQRFLENGFDSFGAVARVRGGAERFLQTLREREQELVDLLFDGDLATCEAELGRILGQAR
ncbi:MAG: hypothetical protein JWP22_2711 [Ramlibacter sp.]|jgi:hypothetical protein|nr:hypothetical protein [Ramlibacter sp.]